MSVGHDIIQEIARGGMFCVHDDCGPIASGLIIVWSSGASEQLEAVVDQHFQKRVNGLIESLLIATDAYASCSTKLNDALVELERLRGMKI